MFARQSSKRVSILDRGTGKKLVINWKAQTRPPGAKSEPWMIGKSEPWMKPFYRMARERTRRSCASFPECLETDTRKGLFSVGDSMKASATALDQPYSVLLRQSMGGKRDAYPEQMESRVSIPVPLAC